MLVYVIRHGQTDWNAEFRLQGQKDIPLNATGRRQATGNGLALADRLGPDQTGHFDFVSSPLHRARETMERMRHAMGLAPLAYRTDERLREVSFGDWEGFTMADLEREMPERVGERELSKWDFIPPGDAAESYEILSWRVAAWLNDVCQPTVCVAHGGVIRALFKIFGTMNEDDASVAAIPQDKILKIDGHAIHWL